MNNNVLLQRLKKNKSERVGNVPRVINHSEAITHKQALSVLLSYHRWGIKLKSVLQNRNNTCEFASVSLI